MDDCYVHGKCKWHARETDYILERLDTDTEKGLSAAEVRERLEMFGPNELKHAPPQHPFIRFLKYFHDVLIYILFVAAFITLALGHYADTVIILVVAVINAAIGFFQENKAEKALEGIKKMLSSRSMVIRDGRRMEIDSTLLTIGDIVLLDPGDKVPADIRLLRANNLKVEESALTGESEPVIKQVGCLDAEAELADRANMAFSGTSVSAGTGMGVVVHTGQNTELGRISQMMQEVDMAATPLIRQMAAFGKSISVIIVGIALAVFLFGRFFRDYSSSELLLSTIGLAIAAIPEGLPAIMSIILAIGVRNMAERKAIVRNLPSVETLGSVTTICSDKTGTLTRNEMTVTALVARGEEVSVTGTGYVPEGSLCRDNEEFTVEADSLLGQLIRCLADCNDASISRDEQENWQVQGDPTEGALLVLRKKAGLEDTPIQRIATLPFDSEYKYMAVLVQKGEERFLLIKGAPDRLLDMADMQKTEDGREPLDRAWWDEAILNQARQGRRVLGAAVKAVDPTATGITHEDLASVLVFLGVAAIIDPPREEAIEAVRSCQSAGIRVKMITGDHLETAKAISTQIGIGDGEHALSGKELDEMDPDHLARAVQKYDVFARTSPEHKLRLVEALQAGGSIAAMTGDGVNDAPALRKADVGIAMGIKGTEVTKEAAEIVLADDNFRTIAVAVEEGRRVYDNLRKTILFILPTNGAESFLIIAAILFGTMIPLTPVQILWVNMVTSVTVSLALAFEKAEPDIMRRAPRNPKAPLLGPYFMWRIFFVSVLIGGLTLIMNQMMLHRGYDPQTVRTVTLQTIVMCQVFHLFNSRSIRSAALCQEFFSNRAVFVVCGLMLVLQLGVTYLPFMNSIFGTVPIGAVYWLIPILLGLVVFLVVEGEKAVMRRLDKRAWMRANPGRPMEEMPPVCGL